MLLKFTNIVLNIVEKKLHCGEICSNGVQPTCCASGKLHRPKWLFSVRDFGKGLLSLL